MLYHSRFLLCFQREANLPPHALVYAAVAAEATALRRRSKLHSFPVVAASVPGRADDVAALHRRARCSNPLTAAASVANGAVGPVVAAAPQRLRPKYRAHLAAALLGRHLFFVAGSAIL